LITAVDTSVLIDVFGNDPRFGGASADGLRDCLRTGTLIACDIVCAETRAVFPDDASFAAAMTTLGVQFSPVNETSARHAGSAWQAYRKTGGKRTRVMADFIIGAHALHQADRLLTRDRGYFRSYFAGLRLVDPAGR
jgi:predicted nucleic acid-binding protein